MKTIERMETFLVLAECGSFTEAAKRLHCSQPTVSHHIQQLEEHFRAPLFRRAGKIVQLTEQGKIVLEYSKQVTRLIGKAAVKVQQSLRQQENILSVYVSSYISNYYLPEILPHYLQSFPEQLLEIYAHGYTELQLALLEERTNFAFLPIYPEDEQLYTQFDKFILFEDAFPLVIPADHPWTKRKQIYIRDLHQETILLPHSRYLSQHIESQLKRRNVKVRFLQMSNFNMMIQAIKVKLGIAFLPYPVIKAGLSSGELVAKQVSSLSIKRKNGLFVRKNTPLTEAERSFCREMKAYFSRS